MINKRRIAMAIGTASCALSIGFVLQNTAKPRPVDVQPVIAQQKAQPKIEATVAVQVPTPDPHPHIVSPVDALPPAAASDAPLEIDRITLTAADSKLSQEVVVASNSQPRSELPQPPADPDTPRLGCDGKVSVRSSALASVIVRFESPCRTNERLTIHHSGLMFTGSTDQDGIFEATIPALSEAAVFILDFATGDDVVATAQVPDLSDYDRVAVQWSGPTGFEVHAREFGASYGDAGHVWSGATSTQAHGHMVRLGDTEQANARIAEIYTFPRANAEQSGAIALSVEAEVTLANCGKDISAQALEVRDSQALRTREMFLSMPNCSAIGDFLVLNNLLDDLKIAAN